jgi:hypothetical protein
MIFCPLQSLFGWVLQLWLEAMRQYLGYYFAYITKNDDAVLIVDVGMVFGFWDEYYFSVAKVSGHVALL